MKKIATAIAAILVTVSAASVAQAVELAAHRAFYRLSLASASNESNMAGVEGAISYEIKDACDAWIVEQNFALRFQLANGGDIDSVDKYVSWESKDGLEYRFNITRLSNGQETETVGGRAELESPGGAGMAIFDEPSRDRIALSKGTVFPTEHTVILLEKAASGARFDRHLLFDGSKIETSAPVMAVVLKQQEGIGGEIIKAPLGPAAIWPMQLAFYAAEGAGQQGEEFPDFEMTMNIQPNGVVTSLVLNFGEFKVNGVLEKIEELPSSGC
ncbi:MAG: DUF1849 family protein [Alphaproteobacteria bacterium]|nr:DUF1849 family protein [Alphaproteobacteria bacterium]